MHQKDHKILNAINLQTPAIVVNQADRFDYEKIEHRGNDALFITLPERGVGLSRNTALMRADADIVVFADESVVYDDNYERLILGEFEKNPKADMIVFNVPIDDPSRKTYTIRKRHRVRRYNSLRYGAVRMAVKLEYVKSKNLAFSLLFGGGAKYQSGEDSIFIYNALQKGLKVYAVPETIGHVKEHKSTWFKGYDDKFFIDKGALFKALSANLYHILILQFTFRKKETMGQDRSIRNMLILMYKGAKGLI